MAGLYPTEGTGIVPWFLLNTDAVPLCAETDPDAFFSKDYFDEEAARPRTISYENERIAKAICAECPMKLDCATYAIETGQHGIWGGTTESERLAIRRGRGIKLQRSLGLTPTKRVQNAVK
jgi:WhiB family redox-sensing transcriptional regulator